METSHLIVAPISKGAAWVLWGLGVSLFVWSIWRGADGGPESMVVQGAMAGFAFAPFGLLASLLGRRARLTPSTLLAGGWLFGGTRIERQQVKRLVFRQGLGSLRGLRLYSGRNMIALSSLSPGFWPVARALHAWAHEDGIEVQWPRGSDAGQWFAPATQDPEAASS